MKWAKKGNNDGSYNTGKRKIRLHTNQKEQTNDCYEQKHGKANAYT